MSVSDRRPCVLFLAPSLDAVSGISTHARLLIQSELARDIRFEHFQVGSEGRSESTPRRVLRLLVSPLRLSVAIFRTRADIVHINTAMDPKAYWRDLWYVAVSRILGKRIVLQVHGGELPGQMFAGRALLTGLLRGVLRASDVVLLITRLEREAYARFVPASRIEYIPNAISTDGLLQADPARALRSGSLHVVFLGRLVASKGVFEIVTAAGLLRDRGVAIRVTLAGVGPAAAALKRRIAEAGLLDRIEMPGPMFGAAKARLWREADLFAFPTYHKEGVPYALLEAMAAAVVPVVSSIGGIPDVISDGEHGLFVKDRDPEALATAIALLDADRQRLVRLAAAARERVVTSFTVSRITAEFLSLYKSLQKVP